LDFGSSFSSETGTVYRATQRAIAVDTIAVSDQMEAEISTVLQEGFSWPQDRIGAMFLDILANAIRVRIHGTVKVCRDPDDDKLLECAERADAEIILTSDKDLLSLGSYKRIRIITPAEYLQL
jgi:putative PIN family toxin of toxin-antitoxin system